MRERQSKNNGIIFGNGFEPRDRPDYPGLTERAGCVFDPDEGIYIPIEEYPLPRSITESLMEEIPSAQELPKGLVASRQ